MKFNASIHLSTFHSFFHSLFQSLTHALTHARTLIHSLTHSRTHALTQAHNQSRIQSVSHSLSHSVNHYFFFCTLQTSAASASPYILMLFVIVFGGHLADCLSKYFLRTGAVRKILNTLGEVHFVSLIRFIEQQQEALFSLGLTEVFFQGYILTEFLPCHRVRSGSVYFVSSPTVEKRFLLKPFDQSTRRIYLTKSH